VLAIVARRRACAAEKRVRRREVGGPVRCEFSLHSFEARGVIPSETMHRWLALLLAGASLHAAVIRGSVVNHDGGEPLSHAEVRLMAIAGSGGATLTARTDSFGMFAFPAVRAGAYLVSASRQYWVTALYGQKRWNSAGMPVVVDANDSLTLSVRMHRFGVITGRVVDENDVGILGHEVMAYRDAKPAQIAARASTDDYGRYRLYGLTPGTYLVRSAGITVDGVSYLPAFAPGAQEMDQARRVDVQLDLDSTGIEVHPAQGRLFEVRGQVSGGAPVELTLAGETGRQTITVSGAFRFNPVAPGRYEIYGTAPARSNCGASGVAGAYMSLPVDRDVTGLGIALSCVQPTQISYMVQGGTVPDISKLSLRARRVDLAGIGDGVTIWNGVTSAVLAPGRWEVLLQPSAGYAVTGFYHSSSGVGLRNRPDGWNLITAGGYGFVRFTLSNRSGSLGGVVIGSDREPVMGAPVYLEAYDRESKARIGELRTGYTGVRGAYEFSGLAPGAYRVLATFEYLAPDTAAMELGAKDVSVGASDTQTRDLDLFVLP
jgi:hypothetical protein